MSIFNFIKDFFKPVNCYCTCHDKDPNIISGRKPTTINVVKGGYSVHSCEHCFKGARIKKSKKWGTAVPKV
jgi:hypothetical protein